MTNERPPIRIGTAERDAAMKALGEHLEAGRLEVDEYGERSARASVATTAPELAALFDDLPAPHPLLPGIDDPLGPRQPATAGRRVHVGTARAERTVGHGGVGPAADGA